MPYSDFRLDTFLKSFNLTQKRELLFENVEPVGPDQWLIETLERGMQLALVSEKARSEMIVTPVLLSSRKSNHNRFAIYSGVRLDVDPNHGLAGECDFILTQTPPLLTLQSPIMAIVEAKKQDIEAGVGQCAAQMLGARLFNQNENDNNTIETIFGCVTTGEDWQFLKLEDNTIWVDSLRYYIVNVDRILGVLQAIVNYYQ